MMGLVVPQRYKQAVLEQLVDPNDVPIVFVTHFEHHSNEISWRESLAEVIELPPTASGAVDPAALRDLLEKYKMRSTIIGSFSQCSNVTGIFSPIHTLAQLMHEYGGYCFVDFACSAPYVDINMHPPNDPGGHLDAIFFSPHKFLGGPGSSGVLVFNTKLPGLHGVPDQPAGGTVKWTNPWNEHRYVDDIEAREDGGTPGFLQAIKAALAVQLKEEMGVEAMSVKERTLMDIAIPLLRQIEGIELLGDLTCERLPIISFYVQGVHHNLIVKLLNDKFGVQARGGCACAGPYGHHLLGIEPGQSKGITDQIDSNDSSNKPGWVRLALHPTMSKKECSMVIGAIKDVVLHVKEWQQDYMFDSTCAEYTHVSEVKELEEQKVQARKQLLQKGRCRRRSLAVFQRSRTGIILPDAEPQ